MASATGLLNRRTLQWDPEIPQFLGLDPRVNLLPLSEEPGVQVRGKSVVCIIGDGAAGNIGSGAVDSNRLALNFGTSAALRTCTTAPVEPAGGLFHYRLDPRHSVYGGALNNAGNLHAWLLNTLRLSEEQLQEALNSEEYAGPIADLRAAPFWGGERSPFWDADLCGIIHGLRFHHQPLHIYLAVMDAAFYRIAALADLLDHTLPAPPEPRQIVISGGLVESNHSLQRLANILRQPLGLIDDQEVSLRGAAVMALHRTQGGGWFPQKIRHQVEPQPHRAREFQDFRARHEEFFNAS
jgi:gluconokinase